MSCVDTISDAFPDAGMMEKEKRTIEAAMKTRRVSAGIKDSKQIARHELNRVSSASDTTDRLACSE